MNNTRMINGIDVKQLGDIVEVLCNQPELAKFQFRVRNNWLQAGQNHSEIKGFYGAGQEDASRPQPFVLQTDTPSVLLGQNTAPTSGEYLLHALAACMTTTLIYNATLHGIVIEEIEVSMVGDIDLQGVFNLRENVRPGFEQVQVQFRIKSDATTEQLERLLASSPARDILENPVPLHLAVEKLEPVVEV